MDTLESFTLRDLIEPLAIGLITGGLGLLFFGSIIAGSMLLAAVALYGLAIYIGRRCERSNRIQQTAYLYWCDVCVLGTEHIGGECQECRKSRALS